MDLVAAAARAESPPSAAPPNGERARRLQPVDLLLLGYVAATSIIATVRLHAYPSCAWVLVSNAFIVVLIMLLARDGLGAFGQALRDFYPLVLLAALYGQLDILNGGGSVAVYDAQVQRWDALLFGGQPSRDWWQAAPSAFWSTLLHAAYFGYYFIIAVPPIVLLARRDLTGLRRFVFAVMVTFVVCYLCFLLYPVAGPYYAFPRPTGPFVDNPAARLVYATLASGSSYGAAFPSSHVAASVTAMVAAWRASPRLGAVFLLPTGLLTVSVVYCQMHYAVDAIAGLVVGLAACGALYAGPRGRGAAGPKVR